MQFKDNSTNRKLEQIRSYSGAAQEIRL